MWQEGARKWTANNILLGGSTPVWPRPPALGPSAAAPQPGPGPPEARPAGRLQAGRHLRRGLRARRCRERL